MVRAKVRITNRVQVRIEASLTLQDAACKMLGTLQDLDNFCSLKLSCILSYGRR